MDGSLLSFSSSFDIGSTCFEALGTQTESISIDPTFIAPQLESLKNDLLKHDNFSLPGPEMGGNKWDNSPFRLVQDYERGMVKRIDTLLGEQMRLARLLTTTLKFQTPTHLRDKIPTGNFLNPIPIASRYKFWSNLLNDFDNNGRRPRFLDGRDGPFITPCRLLYHGAGVRQPPVSSET